MEELEKIIKNSKSDEKKEEESDESTSSTSSTSGTSSGSDEEKLKKKELKLKLELEPKPKQSEPELELELKESESESELEPKPELETVVPKGEGIEAFEIKKCPKDEFGLNQRECILEFADSFAVAIKEVVNSEGKNTQIIDEALRACGSLYQALLQNIQQRVHQRIRASADVVPLLVKEGKYALAAGVCRAHCLALLGMKRKGFKLREAYVLSRMRPIDFYSALVGMQVPGDANAPSEVDGDWNVQYQDEWLEETPPLVHRDVSQPEIWLKETGYTSQPLSSVTKEDLESLHFEIKRSDFPGDDPDSFGFTAADLTKGCTSPNCWGRVYRDSNGKIVGAVMFRTMKSFVPLVNLESIRKLPFSLPQWRNNQETNIVEILRFPVTDVGNTWLERCILTHSIHSFKNEFGENSGEALCSRVPVAKTSEGNYVVDSRRATFWHKHFKLQRCFSFNMFDDSIVASRHFSSDVESPYGIGNDEQYPTMLRPFPSMNQIQSFAAAVLKDRPHVLSEQK
jgi:hypothetical protein